MNFEEEVLTPKELLSKRVFIDQLEQAITQSEVKHDKELS